jgi:hypothetical protein
MKLNESINQLLLALIIGVVSLGVSHVSDLSKSVQSMTLSLESCKASIQELNYKIGQVFSMASDHEARLRELERNKHKEK